MDKTLSAATKNSFHKIGLASFLTRGVLFLLKGYQKMISPFLGDCCRFYPSCSFYAIEAIEKWGLFRGSWFAVQRVIRCQPLHPGGCDPIP